MNRKAHGFILILILGIVALPPLADAQETPKVPRIGFLSWGSPPPADLYGEPFRQGLRELGYVEGQNIAVEYRWTEERSERAAELAAELVRLRVDVIVAWISPAIKAAQNATRTIPIVMGGAADPVGMGLVASLARPGGNTTGPSLMIPDLAGKRLELLREVLPRAGRVAFLFYTKAAGGRRMVEETQVAAQRLGVRIQPVGVGGPEEFESAFAAMRRERAGGLIVEPFLVRYSGRIVDLAAKHRLPTISDYRAFPEAGGLLSYGPNRGEMYGRTATYVDRILKGARPADLPVEQPTRFELVINMKTARALGVTFPQSVLIRADRVIQ